jgi:hypothetical protein
MPITALCPYCRAGGVRAHERAIGMSATCPKCGSSFTVVPTTEKPVREVPPEPEPLPFAREEEEVADTRAHAATDGVTEPSPVLAPVRTNAPATAALEPEEEGDPAYVAALVALTLFGVGLVASQLPFGRFVALGLTGVGLVLGLVCLAAEGRARTAAAAAAGFNALAVVLLLLAPTWIGLTPWKDPPPDPGPKGPQAVAHGNNLSEPAEWVDASTASWALNDVRVTVRGASVGPVELVGPSGAKRKTREAGLTLVVRVSNEGVQRKIPLAGWAAGDPAAVRVTDPDGAVLAPKAFDAGWRPAPREDLAERPGQLFPGKAADVVLVFEAPAARPAELRLELPGVAVGVPEPAKFVVRGSFVSGRWAGEPARR